MRGFTATCPTTANACPCRPVCSRTHTPRIRSHILTSQTTPAGNPPAAQLGCCEFKRHSIRQTYSPGTACKNHPWSSWCCPAGIRDAGRIVVDFGGAKKWKYSTGTGCVCACVRACVCACESVPCLCVLCGSSNSGGGGSGSGSNNSKRLGALCGAARDNKVVSHRGRQGLGDEECAQAGPHNLYRLVAKGASCFVQAPLHTRLGRSSRCPLLCGGDPWISLTRDDVNCSR